MRKEEIRIFYHRCSSNYDVFWIFDWEKLITPIGLAGWGGSIIVGFMVYSFYAARERKKSIKLQRHILIGSTMMTVCLAVLALIIEWITSSMP
ncbi:hypothetical protein [Saccharococcus thermophilus]|uniref:hypothetical protein n=1 Tax=Saccharococcus thermophilus TaxID=29396 RepID=UPI0036071BD5